MSEDPLTTKVRNDIVSLKNFWTQRNIKFQDWYELLTLVDVLASKGMETYVSNEPMTFYNMAHYLLTKGELSHTSPIQNETALELERRARVHRSCVQMWDTIDRNRQLGGQSPFLDDLGFYLLVLGWYSVVEQYDNETGELNAQLWNPYDVYPRYNNGRMSNCVHIYKCSELEAIDKANANGWDYDGRPNPTGEVTISDYFVQDSGVWWNLILIDD